MKENKNKTTNKNEDEMRRIVLSTGQLYKNNTAILLFFYNERREYLLIIGCTQLPLRLC